MGRQFVLWSMLLPVAAHALEAVNSRSELRFEQNVGQTAEQVSFISRGATYTLWLMRGGATFRTGDSNLKMNFIGADPVARAVGAEPLHTHVHYLLGNDPKQWHVDVPTFGRVEYRGIYPGIDLVYSSDR